MEVSLLLYCLWLNCKSLDSYGDIHGNQSIIKIMVQTIYDIVKAHGGELSGVDGRE
jgi:hypothetical protein